MSEGVETVERAILFEGAAGDRQRAARACLESWLSDYDYSLLQADVGLRESAESRQAGRALFVILRFREDRFTDTTHAALVAAAEHAFGSVIALSELEYQDRGHFLSRFAECGWQRLGIAPDEVPKALDEAFAQGGAERRASVRHNVEAPGVLSVGEKKVAGTVENLSAGGALVRTTSPPVLQAKVELEVTLPGGPVRAAATVLNVSERGVALQFAPAATPAVQAKLDTLPPAPSGIGAPPQPPSGGEGAPPQTPGGVQGIPATAPPFTPSGVEGASRPRVERVGNYELLSLLGTGGTSDVHFARVVDGPTMGTYVALKRLNKRRAEDPAAVRAFEAEAKTLSLLKHPNIVRTLDTGVFDGHHCLVMEVIEGHDLSQILRKCRSRKKPLPLDVACFLAKVLLDALGAVHSAKDEAGTAIDLVHGDVSPHNVFISKTGIIKLGDFGRAKRAGTLLSRAVNEGRPSYLSPEALAGEVHASSDLWAAAVTLYELLTLEQPFVGNTLDELTLAIRSKKEKPLRDRRDEISGPLEAVVRTALEKNRAHRFQSAKAFADALSVHFHPVRTPRAVPELVKDLFATGGKGRPGAT